MWAAKQILEGELVSFLGRVGPCVGGGGLCVGVENHVEGEPPHVVLVLGSHVPLL